MKKGILLVSLFFANAVWADLTVFTDRPQNRFTNVVEAFTQKTGQKVTFVEGSYKDLLKSLEEKSTADLIITKDLVYLNELTEKGLLQPMTSTPSVQKVHSSMRDPNNNWVAISFRVRSAAYDPSRVSANELTTYEDLASAKWLGRLCLRTSKAAYNEALVSELISRYGEERARAIVEGWVANLAAPPFPNDTAALEAVANGTCDVAIVNHYYLAQLVAKNPNFPVKMAFLDQSGSGVHANGTGVAIVNDSQQATLAQEFIDLLLEDDAQLEISAAHFDYPAVENLLPNTLIKDWGTFILSSENWSRLGPHVESARKMMKDAGYN